CLVGLTPAVGLVPVIGLLVGPRAAGRTVAALDVVQAPPDLRGRVGPPVSASARHLRPRQRLGNAVRARARVLRGGVPAALVEPQGLQAGELALRPAVLA